MALLLIAKASAFNAQDLADLSALCLHISYKRSNESRRPDSILLNRDQLTPAKFKLPELVAETNKCSNQLQLFGLAFI